VGTWARLNKPIEVKPGFDPFHLLPAEGRRYDQRFRAVAIVKFGGAAVAVACGAAAVVGVNAREMEQVNASTASAHGFSVQFAWDVPVLVAFLLGVAAAVGILLGGLARWAASPGSGDGSERRLGLAVGICGLGLCGPCAVLWCRSNVLERPGPTWVHGERPGHSTGRALVLLRC